MLDTEHACGRNRHVVQEEFSVPSRSHPEQFSPGSGAQPGAVGADVERARCGQRGSIGASSSEDDIRCRDSAVADPPGLGSVDDVLVTDAHCPSADAQGRVGARAEQLGAGYAGLNLLADVNTDLVKLDMALIRNIDKDKGRRAIARGIIQVCRELSMQVIAEGIETYEELDTLGELGVELFQGYYFARPAFQALAIVPAESYDRRG